MKLNFYLAALVGGLILLGPNWAHSSANQLPDDSCELDFLQEDDKSFGLSKVVGASTEKIKFEYSAAELKERKLKTLPYLLVGDNVVTGKVVPGYTCSLYGSSNGRVTTGWLPTNKLQPLPPEPIPLAAWSGQWTRKGEVDWRSSSIEIYPDVKSGLLRIEGHGHWAASEKDAQYRGPNTGQFSAFTRPDGRYLHVVDSYYETSSCQVDLVLLPPYLLVKDNNQCGGMNVRFLGLYQQ